jgi:hypothetical protein
MIQGLIEGIQARSGEAEEAITAVFDAGLDAVTGTNQAILDRQEELAAEEARINDARASAATSLFGTFGDLVTQNIEDERAAFNAKKAFAIADTLISTSQAVMKSFTVDPTGILAAIIGTKGVLEVAAIGSQQPPAAQFGGSFEVPPGTPADSGLIRVNQGERVDVSPVRSSGGGMQQINLVIDGKVFAKAVVDGVNSGNGGRIEGRLIRA